MKILISEKARQDLLLLYLYLGSRSPTAARRILERTNRKFEQLADFPFIGRERSHLATGLRSALVGTHLIFYVVNADQITIIRVIDGRMDIDEEFRR